MKDLIQRRLERYQPSNSDEELMALKEITQEVALYALQKSGFFQETCFLGGTSLRILHGVDRFSEDLDFATNEPNEKLDLDGYLGKAMITMRAFGYDLSINKKDLDDKTVKSRFLKDDSIKKVLTFKYRQDSRQKIKIKVEVDTNPPAGASRILEYVDFPEDFAVATYDLPSLMAGKLHALLCRPYPKGRDFYDLLWYLANKIQPNLNLLQEALAQQGPWKGKDIKFDPPFIKTELSKKIKSISWDEVKLDIRKFLTMEKAKTLELWDREFFENKLKRI